MTWEDTGVSLAEQVEMCVTCHERPARATGECMTCYLYRRRTGKVRPSGVILANFRRRANGAGNAGHRVLTELRSTLRHVGALHPADPDAPVLCVPCGTAKAWIKGSPIPLCQVHRGWLALVGVVLDEPEDLDRIINAMSA